MTDGKKLVAQKQLVEPLLKRMRPTGTDNMDGRNICTIDISRMKGNIAMCTTKYRDDRRGKVRQDRAGV